MMITYNNLLCVKTCIKNIEIAITKPLIVVMNSFNKLIVSSLTMSICFF